MTESVYDVAPTLVEDRFTDMESQANAASGALNSAVGVLLGIAGTGPTIDTSFTLTYSVPTIPSITFSLGAPPTFEWTDPSEPQEPSVINVTMPNIGSFPSLANTQSINPGQNSYSSANLISLVAGVRSKMRFGDTGVEPDVETAIFNRELERSIIARDDGIDALTNEWAKRGLPLPDGHLSNKVSELHLNFTNKRLDVSRDVAIKSFELAQQNTQFFYKMCLDLETVLINYANGVAQRVFEASKAALDALVEAYKATVGGYSAEISARIEGAKAQLESNRAVVEMYAARVNAYAARVNAEASKNQGKAQTYSASADAYKAEAQAIAAIAEVSVKQMEAEIDGQVAAANVKVAGEKAKGDIWAASKSAQVEAAKGACLAYAQWLAGALSAVNASASLGVTGSSSHDYEELRAIPTTQNQYIYDMNE